MRSRLVPAVLGALLLLPGGSALARKPTDPAPSTPGLDSYRRAREVLEAGVLAMGGGEALLALTSIHRRMEGDWFGSGQSLHPYLATPPTLVPPPTSQHSRIDTILDYAGNRWLKESLDFDDFGDAVTRIQAVAPEQGFESLTYREEKPYFRSLSRDDRTALLNGELRRHPEGLLRLALSRPETLGWVGPGEAMGRSQRVISLADTGGARIFLYFDAGSGLLTKSETLRSHALAGDSFAEVIYQDYRTVGNLKLPFHYVDRVAGIPTEELRVGSIELGAPLPEDRLRPPSVSIPFAEDPPRPVVRELGAGLFLIRGPYNVVFAAFRDHVVVFEAPRNSAYSEECLERIHEAAPGRPVRYVVSTHFHTDHIAGLRPYIAQGIPIVTTPDAEGTIRRVAAARHTLHPDTLSLRPLPPRIETVAGSRSFDDGSNRAELYGIGPTEHAGQILVAYFPRQKVLLEADVWDVVADEQPIAGADAVRLASRIRELGLEVETIIPVHGVPARFTDLVQGMAVRAKYFK